MWRLLGLFILIFQSQYLFAHELIDIESSDAAVIFVSQDAKIYSEDESFSSYIRYLDSQENSSFPNSAESDSLINEFEKEKKLEVEEIKQIILDDTKKKAEKLEENLFSSLYQKLYSSVPSDDFIVSKSTSKDYVAPRPTNQDQYKYIYISESQVPKKGLVYLYKKQFVYLTTTSFDRYLFSFIYTRPPPFYCRM